MSSPPQPYTLSRKEGWFQMAAAPARVRPERLTRRALARLSPRALAEYNDARAAWHANLGPFKTPQLASIHDTLWEILDSNRQDGDRVKGTAAIDALPGLGKTTIANTFGRAFHQRTVNLHGTRTSAGHERIPVCHIGLTSNTTMRTLNLMLLEFYAHPARVTGSAAHLAIRALDCILSCETKLIIVDDVHFLNMRRRDSIEMSNHFKWLANEFPVTFLFIGVGLQDRGLVSEGLTGTSAAMAQTARRWTRLAADPFEIATEDGRRNWRALLLAIESRLVLADIGQGMIADDLFGYLFARSTGHIGSLMTLITRGCYRAIKTRQERLTKTLLDGVRNDEAAEAARQELLAAIAAGRLPSRMTTAAGRAVGAAARD
jgi:hypothetical protein